MRTYNVPPDVNEKEKIVGGFLDLNQFFWILGGFVIGIVMFLITFSLLGKGALFVGGVFALSGVPFVFIKIKDLTLFEYLKRKRSFKKKTKYLPNEKIDYEW